MAMNDPTDPLPAAGGRVGPAALFVPPEQWLADLKRSAEVPRTWLWHGYIAPANVTVLTSQSKSGKTTLLSVLLARMKAGGLLAGLSVSAGKAAVVSEESPAVWLDRSRKLDFGEHVCWFCRPFPGKPSLQQWLALLDRLAEIHARVGLSLVVIDPLAAFFPGRGENCAEIMLEFLKPLHRLTALGVAVLLLHHPGKEETAEGLAARGSTATGAFADIVLEMKWYHRPSEADRRRRLVALSRFDETPRQLVIELNTEGTDYLGHGTFGEEEYGRNLLHLRSVLADAPRKLTRQQVARRWPPDAEPPHPASLWRWLEQAVAQGQVLRDGSGRKADPFRYWLPGQEEKWKTPRWQQELTAFTEALPPPP
jgi:hypothetical protein